MSDAPRGLARQAVSTYAETTKYHTFWRRFWAVAVDMLVMLPVLSLGEHLGHPDRGFQVMAAAIIASCLVPVLYRTLMHVRYGQTLGKMATGVKVYDNSEDSLPSLAKSFARDLPDYIVASLTAWHVISLASTGNYHPEAEDTTALGKGLAIGYVIWLFFDSMVLASNFRRRALHDWLASTVVMKYDVRRRPKTARPSPTNDL